MAKKSGKTARHGTMAVWALVSAAGIVTGETRKRKRDAIQAARRKPKRQTVRAAQLSW